ncbi:unnamed protein product [Dimorphilus gyrociliatus]|uniref:Uncharacterized protein n=1 Tax=Dimorphilus gyrociliatus TaxID=2664684 RepID=A0A7I8VNX9_9ANNE|nr:unnamed protein product [Dimorphilus gyrociliatus]
MLRLLCYYFGLFSSTLLCDPFNLWFTTNDKTFHNYELERVKGLPKWLNGTYVRNGPGKFEYSRRKFVHAFDGYAKLMTISIRSGGSLKFSTSFVKTYFYRHSQRIGDIAPYLLFDYTTPKFNRFDRLQQLLHGIDNVNVNIHAWKNDRNGTSYVAVSDFWQVYEIDMTTLGTLKRINAKIPGIDNPLYDFIPLPATSHPLQEIGTNNFITFLSLFSLFPGLDSRIQIIRIKSVEKRELISSISTSRLPYMHSFALTKSWVILLGHPLFINKLKILKTSIPLKSIDWRPEFGTEIFLVHLPTGTIRRMRIVKAVFATHFINAYEESGDIVADFITYDNPKLFDILLLSIILDPVQRKSIFVKPVVMRFRINLRRNTVNIHQIGDVNFDFPIINKDFEKNYYCFAYGLTLDWMNSTASPSDWAGIGKNDLCGKGRSITWSRRYHLPSEVWFERRPGSVYEDDGVLMSVILDTIRRTSYLAILDARTLLLLHAIDFPTYVPFTMHGKFFSHKFFN